MQVSLIRLSFDPQTRASPTTADYELNYQLLYEVLLRFPSEIPQQTLVVEAFRQLDSYWGRKLSKAPYPPANGVAESKPQHLSATSTFSSPCAAEPSEA